MTAGAGAPSCGARNDPAHRLTQMAAAPKPLTLAIDIGGTHIKGSVLDVTGRMVASEVRLPTPAEATPKAVLKAITSIAEQLPDFDRVSAGFPGYVIVDEGAIKTAPNLGTEAWRGFALAEALSAA